MNNDPSYHQIRTARHLQHRQSPVDSRSVEFCLVVRGFSSCLPGSHGQLCGWTSRVWAQYESRHSGASVWSFKVWSLPKIAQGDSLKWRDMCKFDEKVSRKLLNPVIPENMPIAQGLNLDRQAHPAGILQSPFLQPKHNTATLKPFPSLKNQHLSELPWEKLFPLHL